MAKQDKKKRRELRKRKKATQQPKKSEPNSVRFLKYEQGPAVFANRGPSSARVVICMPIGYNGYIHDEAAAWCSEMEKLRAERVSYRSASPEIGRNLAIEDILHKIPDTTHVFCLDSDTVPPLNAISRLLKHDKDIVGGVYPFWLDKRPAWSIYHDEGGVFYYDELPSQLFKLNYVQGGATLIKVEVFEKIGFPYYKAGIEQVSKTYSQTLYSKTSEDGYLCRKAREHGFEVWCDPTIRCKHFKTEDLLEIFDEMAR